MNSIISKTKQSFEASFAEADRYNRQTQDSEHLNSILNTLMLENEDKLLDLGTGSGYLAFYIAKNYPNVTVFGLDIVSDTLNKNRQKAYEEKVPNIEFANYDGINNPYQNGFFDWVVTRYALHHFPDIQHAFCETARVLKPGGYFFISDPTPNENDSLRFVDAYMQLLDDGHNKFYTLDEFVTFANYSGMKLVDYYYSSITFPRKITNEYNELLKKTSDEIKQSYNIKVIDGEGYITEKVINCIFLKN